jgi:hypothetical protein
VDDLRRARGSSTGGPVVALEAAAARPPATGVAVYVSELARALVRRYPERIRLIGVHPDGGLTDLDPSAAVVPPNGRQTSWVIRRADAEAHTAGAQLVHYTNALAPLASKLPYVLTIHDLSLLRQPLSHPPARLLTAPLMIAAAYRATAIIVPSEATAAPGTISNPSAKNQ